MTRQRGESNLFQAIDVPFDVDQALLTSWSYWLILDARMRQGRGESLHMIPTFNKRTFTMPLLLRSMGAALLYMPLRWIALVSPAIPRGLREELFLGVTSVNDCRWCTWLHSVKS